MCRATILRSGRFGMVSNINMLTYPSSIDQHNNGRFLCLALTMIVAIVAVTAAVPAEFRAPAEYRRVSTGIRPFAFLHFLLHWGLFRHRQLGVNHSP